MRYNQMHSIAHQGTHQCAPSAWRRVPKVSGDYDLDATIAHRSNRDMTGRLSMYVAKQGYGPRTAYDPYGVGDD
jgi:hypothetical protein